MWYLIFPLFGVIVYKYYPVIKMVIQVGPIKLCTEIITHKLSEHLVEMHPRWYTVKYPCGVNWYKIIIPRKRGPCLINTILDEKGECVKEELIPFLGPAHNFHGSVITPAMMGKKTLTFMFLDDTKRTFEKDERIHLGNTDCIQSV